MRYTDARYTHTSFDQDAQTRLRLFLSLVVSGNTVFKMSTKIRAFELQSKCVSLRPRRKEEDLGELSERETWGDTSRRCRRDAGRMGDQPGRLQLLTESLLFLSFQFPATNSHSNSPTSPLNQIANTTRIYHSPFLSTFTNNHLDSVGTSPTSSPSSMNSRPSWLP